MMMMRVTAGKFIIKLNHRLEEINQISRECATMPVGACEHNSALVGSVCFVPEAQPIKILDVSGGRSFCQSGFVFFATCSSNEATLGKQ